MWNLEPLIKDPISQCQRVETELRETNEKLDKVTEKLNETTERMKKMEIDTHDLRRSNLELALDNLAIKFAKLIKKKVSRKRYSDLLEKEGPDNSNHSINGLIRQVQPLVANPKRLVELNIEGIEERHIELLKDLSEVSSRHKSHSISIV